MKKIFENKKLLFGLLGVLVAIVIIIVVIILTLGSKRYTISFNTDGGNSLESITAKEKETITLPIAVKEGYIFNGWIDETGKIIPSIYVVTKDVTLKATWISETADTITIKFDTNGGSKIEDIIIVKGETLKLPQNPTKAGYKFVTWETENGTPIYNEALLSESVTLYAVWEKEPSSSSSSKESKPSSSTTIVEPTGVELNTTNKTMVVNTTDKLVATVKPNNAKDKTVTWSSNKPNVITVDKNGNIKAVGLGEATITVKTSNGKTATAKVTSDVRSITLSVVNKTISKYGTITRTTITANIDSNGYSVPNSLITWSAPDASGYTAPAYISTNGKTATLTARDWWGSTSSIPVTVKVNNKEAKTTIYVEPKINISNRSSSNGITCNERDEILYCTFKGEKSLHLQSNIDVTWEYYQNSPIIAGIEGKDDRNLKLSVQYVSQNGLNIKAKSKAGQVKEIVLTPTV